ncbi:protein piccolo-like [Morone saxatilis]|uniref:protein piccolo-like n=1 Tax=Morone saxatilis TaxID=34816 RepID=UPI0015E229B0|nr:protein piccolo-like [Morone saxatilis]
MQRALGASEPTGRPIAKPQPSLSKVFKPPGAEQKDIPTLVQKEKSTESTAVKKEVTPPPQKKETAKAESPLPTAVQRMDTAQQGSMQKTQVPSGTEQGQGKGVAGQQQPVGKSPQVQSSQTTKPEVKAGLAKQETGKPPQQPSKSATPPSKSVPPPAQASKQESGGFYGFGGPKTQPAAAKSAESVTGKMFGFGSSIFSSASTFITSAVQDELKTTPPTPRKMSATPHVSPKPTPPVSPKMSPAKENKPPAAQKSEPPQQSKPASSAQAKLEKTPSEPPKSTEVTQVAPKAGLSTCPLCKVELNMGSKDPNYNTCTECKNTVCNLCGFNPMPHTAVKEWLCLNCQTQRALLGQLGDSGKIPQPSPVSAKPETQSNQATQKAEPKTAPTKAELIPMATESQPSPVPIKAVPTAKAKMEPTSVKMGTTATAASAQIELETTLTPTTAKVSPVTAEKQPLEASTATSVIPAMAPVKHTEVTQKVEVPKADIPKTLKVGGKEEAVELEYSVSEFPKTEESKPDLSTVKVEAGVIASAFPVTKSTVSLTSPIAAEVAMAKVVPETETQPECPVYEEIIKEVQSDDHIKLTEPTQSLQQVKVQPKSQEPPLVMEVEPVVAADSKEVADEQVKKIMDVTSTTVTQLVSTENIIITQ